jgi:hypothetical protein
MKSNNYLIILSILFLILAGSFSVVFWGDISLLAKIGLFVLGFGSGVTAGQWFARRSPLVSKLSSPAPDRLRWRYGAAICQFSCYDDFVPLPEPAVGDPNRRAD